MEDDKTEYMFPDEISALRESLVTGNKVIFERLRKIPLEMLETLVSYYVEGVSAKVLAENYGIGTSAVGGRISAAKRTLRKALGDLVPPVKRNSKG
jgi:DNA-directed RNA polymerase specialized sigma24 family protein